MLLTPRTPDPMPAVRLRHELVSARRAGVRFETAWELAVEAGLGETPGPRERCSWSETFRATRAAWERAFERDAAGGQCFEVLAAADL